MFNFNGLAIKEYHQCPFTSMNAKIVITVSNPLFSEMNNQPARHATAITSVDSYLRVAFSVREAMVKRLSPPLRHPAAVVVPPPIVQVATNPSS